MPMVEVWNDNDLPFEQVFKDKKVLIGAKKKIAMDFEEAVEFKSAFFPPRADGSGQQMKSSYKMIRIGKQLTDDEAEKERQLYVCEMDGKQFDSQAALDTHIDENYLDSLVDQDLATKRKMRREKVYSKG